MATVSLERIERDGIELTRQVQLVRELLEQIASDRKRIQKLSEQ